MPLSSNLSKPSFPKPQAMTRKPIFPHLSWAITFLLCSSPCLGKTAIDTVKIDSIEVFARSTDFFHTTGSSLFPYLYFMEICKARYLKEGNVWYESIKSKEVIHGFSQAIAMLEPPSWVKKVFKRRKIKGGMFEKPLLCLRINYGSGDKRILIFSEDMQFCWLGNEAFLINSELIAFLLNHIEFRKKEDLFLYYGLSKA